MERTGPGSDWFSHSERASPSRTRKPDIWTQDSCADHNRVVSSRGQGFTGVKSHARRANAPSPRLRAYLYTVRGSRSVPSKSLTRNRPNPRFRKRASSARQGGTLPSLSRKRSASLPPLSRVHTREDRPNIRATRSRNRRGFLLTLCASDTGIADRCVERRKTILVRSLSPGFIDDYGILNFGESVMRVIATLAFLF